VRPEVDARGEPREADRADDGSTPRGEEALIVGGMAREQRLGHDEADDRIAEVLEPLVVRRRVCGVLVQEAAVNERLAEKRRVAERQTKARREARRMLWELDRRPSRQEVCSSM